MSCISDIMDDLFIMDPDRCREAMLFGEWRQIHSGTGVTYHVSYFNGQPHLLAQELPDGRKINYTGSSRS